MKKVLFVFVIAAAFTACNNGTGTETKTDSTVVKVDSTIVKVDTTITKVDTAKTVKIDTVKVDTVIKKK